MPAVVGRLTLAAILALVTPTSPAVPPRPARSKRAPRASTRARNRPLRSRVRPPGRARQRPGTRPGARQGDDAMRMLTLRAALAAALGLTGLLPGTAAAQSAAWTLTEPWA